MVISPRPSSITSLLCGAACPATGSGMKQPTSRGAAGSATSTWMKKNTLSRNRSLDHQQAQTGHVQCNVVPSSNGCNRSGVGQTGGHLGRGQNIRMRYDYDIL